MAPQFVTIFQIEEPREQIQSRSSLSGERDLLARMFAKHDVRETSYHVLAPRIDLHLCDDPGRKLLIIALIDFSDRLDTYN